MNKCLLVKENEDILTYKLYNLWEARMLVCLTATETMVTTSKCLTVLLNFNKFIDEHREKSLFHHTH